MRLLAIETTGPYCSAAILDGDDIEERSTGEKLNHLKALTPMIDELLAAGEYSLGDMDAIAESVGPGSFTGIRIGVSTGRALNQVSGVPLISVPTLFAFGCSEYEGNRAGVVLPILNARRNQVYAGAYKDFCEIVPGGPYMLDAFFGMVAGEDDFLIVGDGVDAYDDQIEEICRGKNITMKKKYQDAAGVAEMAADMLLAPSTFEGRIGLSYNELEPEYMRITEAEQRLREGTLGRGLAGKE